LHLDVVHDIVHATSTIAAIDHLEKDETIVAPAGTPRVLDFPVLIELFGLQHAGVGSLLAGVPPFSDAAVGGGGRRRLGVGVSTIITSGVLVSDNDDCVVKRGSALGLLEDS